MIAILTRYLPPTNYRGSRVAVRSGNGHRMIVSWDHELDVSGNHRAAALALCRKMGWTGDLASGGTENGAAHCFIPSDYVPKGR